jgi:hypothetical protein
MESPSPAPGSGSIGNAPDERDTSDVPIRRVKLRQNNAAATVFAPTGACVTSVASVAHLLLSAGASCEQKWRIPRKYRRASTNYQLD